MIPPFSKGDEGGFSWFAGDEPVMKDYVENNFTKWCIQQTYPTKTNTKKVGPRSPNGPTYLPFSFLLFAVSHSGLPYPIPLLSRERRRWRESSWKQSFIL